jgi:hypothetical protein
MIYELFASVYSCLLGVFYFPFPFEIVRKKKIRTSAADQHRHYPLGVFHFPFYLRVHRI